MAPPRFPPKLRKTLEIYNLTGQEVKLSYLFNHELQSTSIDASSCAVVPNISAGIFACPTIGISFHGFNFVQVRLRFPLRGPPSSWCKLKVDPDLKLALYFVKVAGGKKRLVMLPDRNLSCFMKDIPDNVHLSNIVVAGTHDSVSFHLWPFAQCQSPKNKLLPQLMGGVRFVDIRLSVIKNVLISYHGPINQHTLFTDIVGTLYRFLRSEDGKNECVIMSIKQEDFAKTDWSLFSRLVKEVVYHHGDDGPHHEKDPGATPVGGVSNRLKKSSAKSTAKDQIPLSVATQTPSSSRDMWWLQNRVPTLGEARGKIVLFSRFGGDGTGWDNGLEGLGIHPTNWPDTRKEGFEWMCKDTTFRMHDWYDIGTFLSIPEKFNLASEVLKVKISSKTPATIPETPPSNSFPIPVPRPEHHTLPFSYSSAWSFPLALAPTTAKGIGIWRWGFSGVNARFGHWMLDIVLSGSITSTERSAIQDAEGGSEIEAKLVQGTSNDKEGAEQTVKGWVLMDYLDEPAGVARLLAELNFLNVRIPI